jgi:hypothetical protein
MTPCSQSQCLIAIKLHKTGPLRSKPPSHVQSDKPYAGTGLGAYSYQIDEDGKLFTNWTLRGGEINHTATKIEEPVGALPNFEAMYVAGQEFVIKTDFNQKKNVSFSTVVYLAGFCLQNSPIMSSRTVGDQKMWSSIRYRNILYEPKMI